MKSLLDKRIQRKFKQCLFQLEHVQRFVLENDDDPEFNEAVDEILATADDYFFIWFSRNSDNHRLRIRPKKEMIDNDITGFLGVAAAINELWWTIQPEDQRL